MSKHLIVSTNKTSHRHSAHITDFCPMKCPHECQSDFKGLLVMCS